MIDPRGPRFAAWTTSAVLALVLLTGSAELLLAQAVVFALGATGRSPYAWIWKRIPKSPPRELEDRRPPQFAQAVGLAFALLGLVGAVTGTVLFDIATGAALAAAFLNAAFGICLGCELYLILKRVKGVPA